MRFDRKVVRESTLKTIKIVGRYRRPVKGSRKTSINQQDITNAWNMSDFRNIFTPKKNDTKGIQEIMPTSILDRKKSIKFFKGIKEEQKQTKLEQEQRRREIILEKQERAFVLSFGCSKDNLQRGQRDVDLEELVLNCPPSYVVKTLRYKQAKHSPDITPVDGVKKSGSILLQLCDGRFDISLEKKSILTEMKRDRPFNHYNISKFADSILHTMSIGECYRAMLNAWTPTEESNAILDDDVYSSSGTVYGALIRTWVISRLFHLCDDRVATTPVPRYPPYNQLQVQPNIVNKILSYSRYRNLLGEFLEVEDWSAVRTLCRDTCLFRAPPTVTVSTILKRKSTVLIPKYATRCKSIIIRGVGNMRKIHQSTDPIHSVFYEDGTMKTSIELHMSSVTSCVLVLNLFRNTNKCDWIERCDTLRVLKIAISGNVVIDEKYSMNALLAIIGVMFTGLRTLRIHVGCGKSSYVRIINPGTTYKTNNVGLPTILGGVGCDMLNMAESSLSVMNSGAWEPTVNFTQDTTSGNIDRFCRLQTFFEGLKSLSITIDEAWDQQWAPQLMLFSALTDLDVIFLNGGTLRTLEIYSNILQNNKNTLDCVNVVFAESSDADYNTLPPHSISIPEHARVVTIVCECTTKVRARRFSNTPQIIRVFSRHNEPRGARRIANSRKNDKVTVEIFNKLDTDPINTYEHN
jgi:hypothetical protein